MAKVLRYLVSNILYEKENKKLSFYFLLTPNPLVGLTGRVLNG